LGWDFVNKEILFVFPRLLRTVAEALNFLHQHGVVHVDVSPRSVAVTSATDISQVKLSGFGSAKPLEADGFVTATGEGSGACVRY
jgi:eukaryotic-like serine/threonine-protein kinase